MFHVVLYQPEIPPNTGNIIRLCANSGCKLHLIGPLGFELEDKRLRRAGLDYREWADVRVYEDEDGCLGQFDSQRIFPCSTKGSRYYADVAFQSGDVFLFGPETRGLPESLRSRYPATQCLKIPMLPESRSLNLSNAVSIFVYEAWRQQGFKGSI